MSGKHSPLFFAFGTFRIDPLRRLLLRDDGQLVPLTPKAFELLLLLIESRGRVLSKDELMNALWADRFVEEANLAQTVSMLRKALGEQRQEHRYVVTEPGRGYRFVAEVEEVCTVENQNSDPTTEGQTRPSFVDGPQAAARRPQPESGIPGERAPHSALTVNSASAPHRKRFSPSVTFILCVLLIGGACVGAYYLRRGRGMQVSQVAPRVSEIKSVAVLPLKNLSEDASSDYFSDGLTESLISTLSKLDGVKVISRGSVFSFKGRDVDPQEVGKQLGVAAVLEGSVLKEGERVRIAVRLVSTEDGRVLWASEINDYALRDIFILQDEVARSVATGLKGRPDGERQVMRRDTNNVEAYQLYLKGRYFWNKRTQEGLKKGSDYFEQAIKLDPNYALAYAGLADSYALHNLYTGLQVGDVFPKAKAAAVKALELDDTLAEAHTSLAYIKYYYEWDWLGAEAEFKRAIELNPNYATAHQWYAEYLFYMERFDESITEIKRAHELDPLSLVINTELGSPYLYMRQYDQAMEKYRKALEMDASFPLAVYCMGLCYEQKSMFKEAINAFGDRKDMSSAALGYVYAVSGRRRDAQEMLKRIMRISKQHYFSPYLIAKVHTGLGEREQAFAWLEKAYEERDERMVMLRVDMHFDSLRSDPRFRDLLRRMKLTS